MCGICGIFGGHAGETIQRMNAAMVHRGPDSEGYYQSTHCSLGMRRLKIIDLEGSEQPIYNEDRTIVVVCNGEIYNYRHLREQLEDRGHTFQTDGDVEVIVHLYEEYGRDCVRHLEGMFVFAVYDECHRRLFLFRDRLGIKPLYWVKLPGQILFASEIKSLLASGVVSPELDELAILRYTAFPAVPAPFTIIRQIRALQPGHLLKVDFTGTSLREYWDVDFVRASHNRLTPDESYEALFEELSRAIQIRLMSDVPLGAFLSGGIDSSAVVAIMGLAMNIPVRTFSIRFTGEEKSFDWFDDASFASTVANAFGTKHTEEIITGADVYRNLADAIWAMDQPSGDAIQYYLVSQSAAREVTVALSGTGGDEVFAGYEWFGEIRRNERIHERLKWLSPNVADRMLKVIKYHPRRYQLPKLIRKLETVLLGRAGFHQRYLLNRRLYRNEDFFYHFSQDFISKIVDLPLRNEAQLITAAARCEGLDPVSKTSYMQLKTDMPNLLVRDQDAVSMAHSLEVRLPLLDHRIVELAARIPPGLKLHGKQEKFILREVLKNILPEEITNRKKKGFMLPMSSWMRNELKPVVESCLSRESTIRRGIFNPAAIDHLRKDFFAGKQPFFKVWNQVAFELWCRINLDRKNGWERPSGDIRDFI